MLLDHLCLAKSKAYTSRKKVVQSEVVHFEIRRVAVDDDKKPPPQPPSSSSSSSVSVSSSAKLRENYFPRKRRISSESEKTKEPLLCSSTYLLSLAASACATASAAASATARATASVTASARASSTANDTAGIC